MKRLFKFSLLPMLMSVAFVAQAVVSVDHIHLNSATEIECSVCLTLSDLAPASTSLSEVNKARLVLKPFGDVPSATAEAIAPQSRGPPTQI